MTLALIVIGYFAFAIVLAGAVGRTLKSRSLMSQRIDSRYDNPRR